MKARNAPLMHLRSSTSSQTSRVVAHQPETHSDPAVLCSFLASFFCHFFFISFFFLLLPHILLCHPFIPSFPLCLLLSSLHFLLFPFLPSFVCPIFPSFVTFFFPFNPSFFPCFFRWFCFFLFVLLSFLFLFHWSKSTKPSKIRSCNNVVKCRGDPNISTRYVG